MSTSNRISEVIPADIIIEVTKKLTECRAALAPYLFGLTDEERHDLFKMGDKTVATVQKVKTYLDTNPEFAPTYMSVEEFKKDEAVTTVLTPLHNLSNQLSTDIDDTILLAGSEALAEALFYYGSVREAANKGVVQAKPIYEDLKQRFTKKGKKKDQ